MNSLDFYTQQKICSYLSLSQIITLYQGLNQRIDPRLLIESAKQLQKSQYLLPRFKGEIRMILLCQICGKLEAIEWVATSESEIGWNPDAYGPTDKHDYLTCRQCCYSPVFSQN